MNEARQQEIVNQPLRDVEEKCSQKSYITSFEPSEDTSPSIRSNHKRIGE